MRNVIIGIVAIAATLFSLNVNAQTWFDYQTSGCGSETDIIWDCGKVGIGTSSPAVDLDVAAGTEFDPFASPSPLFFQGITASETGMVTTATMGGSNDNVAMIGYAQEDDKWNVGGIFIGEGDNDPGTEENNGVVGVATGDAFSCTGVAGNAMGSGDFNSGVAGNADGASDNKGGVFQAYDANASKNFGIAAGAGNGTSNWSGAFLDADVAIETKLGIGTTFDPYGTASSPTEVLDVDGNGRFRSVGSGTYANDLNLTSTGVLTTSSSDARLKEDISPLENTLDKVLQLEAKTYYWKDDTRKDKKDIGFIAQDVEDIFPEVVFTNKVDGYMGINYSRFPAILAEAIKEQQSIIDEKDAEIKDLNERLTRLEAMLLDNNGTSKPGNNGSKPGLGNAVGTLDQNQPNPFANSTTITYTLSEASDNAYISVMNISGKELMTKRLESNERGQVEVSLSQLGSGIYFYSLVVDGSIIATKPMVKM